MFSACDSAIPLGHQMAHQPVPDAHFTGDIEEYEQGEQEQHGFPQHRTDLRKEKACAAGGGGHVGREIDGERDRSDRRHQKTEPRGVLREKIRRDETASPGRPNRRRDLQEIERGRAIRRVYAAGKRIGAGHDNSSADAKQKHQRGDGSERT